MSFGRKRIFSVVEEINASNVVEEIKKALGIHATNQRQITFLEAYKRGIQPILEREKEIRPEINNKVVENHALEIVSFKTGYTFGEPVQYVMRGEDEETADKIKRLNDFMLAEDKPARDKEVAEWLYTGGTAYRMVLPGTNGNPFEIDTLDPRHTFVIYRDYFKKPPLAGVKFIETEEGRLYSVYTPTTYFELLADAGGVEIRKQEPHPYGDIPIIEYPSGLSMLGCFEPVIPMLDTLNKLASNRMDGVEQFVQSFLKFVNCDIDTETFKQLREQGALKVTVPNGDKGDVDIISSELDQTQVQTLVDYTYQQILTICGIPDRRGAYKTSGDTGQAVLLRDGWGEAEASAREVELMFKMSEKRFLRLALRYMKVLEGVDLNVNDIEIKFVRNRTDNLLVKVQGMQGMLEAGIDPATAIEHSNLFSDPVRVSQVSEPYLKKWEFKEAEIVPSNNKPNPGENM